MAVENLNNLYLVVATALCPGSRYCERRNIRDCELLCIPRGHWRRIRTNNPLERIMKEIRRRTRVVGSFPDGNSALMLVSARAQTYLGNKMGDATVFESGPALGG